MLFRDCFLTLIFIPALSGIAYAQSKTPTLMECIEQAKSNNIAIKMAQ